MSISKYSRSDEIIEEEAIKLFLFESIEDFAELSIPQRKRGPRTEVDYWDTNWNRNL